jgi:hypothetical protein
MAKPKPQPTEAEQAAFELVEEFLDAHDINDDDGKALAKLGKKYRTA